ncbi:unnamed protein product [Lactuca saligna]|uniref:Cobalamin-independent methionine synthase MetE N-terminal domain-containing protein n=1 Tax=Lactuca saligna TaxID=75948 RepID=A0AA35V4K1_LACSI|nr:unnamed protein product [Lactuca saligna]
MHFKYIQSMLLTTWLRVETVAVFVGPVSYLLLSKLTKESQFHYNKNYPCMEVIVELKEAGFTKAYSELESAFSGHNVIVANYFADIPAEAFKTLTSLPGVSGFTFDFIRGEKALDLIKSSFPSGKYLFAGVVDGRNIWANDLVGSLAGHKNEAFFSANVAVQVSRKSSPRVTNESLQKVGLFLCLPQASDLLGPAIVSGWMPNRNYTKIRFGMLMSDFIVSRIYQPNPFPIFTLTDTLAQLRKEVVHGWMKLLQEVVYIR